MTRVPSGTELARPCDLRRRFRFILQRCYQQDWAEDFMIELMVDDLDPWWNHLQSLDRK